MQLKVVCRRAHRFPSETGSVWFVHSVPVDGSGLLPSLWLCSAAAPDGASHLLRTLPGDWRFQAGPWSLPPLTHFQRCSASMTFTALQGRVVHLQEKNKQTWKPQECKCTDPAHLTVCEYGISVSLIMLTLTVCVRTLKYEMYT